MIIYARIISDNLVMQYLRFLHFSHETHQNLYAHIWGCPERLKKYLKNLRPFQIFINICNYKIVVLFVIWSGVSHNIT